MNKYYIKTNFRNKVKKKCIENGIYPRNHRLLDMIVFKNQSDVWIYKIQMFLRQFEFFRSETKKNIWRTN
jgi:hypothetical protein